MAARNIEEKGRVTSRQGAFGSGTAMAAPGSATGAGGGNLKSGRSKFNQSGGGALNGGRSRRANPVEKHHNGGTASIKQGSTAPAR
jgi:hypothetical protein